MDLQTFPKVVVFDLDSTLWDGDIEYATSGPPYTWDSRGLTLRDRQNNRLPVFKDAFGIMRWLELAEVLDLSLSEDRQKLMDALPCPKLLSEVRQKYSKKAAMSPPRDNLSNASTASSLGLTGEGERFGRSGHYLKVAYASRPCETKWSPQALRLLTIPSSGTESSNFGGSSFGGSSLGGSISGSSLGRKTFWDIAIAAEIYPGEKSTHLKRIAKAADCSISEIILYDNEQRNIYTANKIGAFGKLTYDGLNWRKFLEGLYEYQQTCSRSL